MGSALKTASAFEPGEAVARALVAIGPASSATSCASWIGWGGRGEGGLATPGLSALANAKGAREQALGHRNISGRRNSP